MLTTGCNYALVTADEMNHPATWRLRLPRSGNDYFSGLSGMTIGRLLAAAVAVVLGTGVALAESDTGRSDNQGQAPEYMLENLRPSIGETAVGSGVGGFQLKANIVPSGTVNVGPVITTSPQRDDFAGGRIDSPSGVDPAWEAGAFVDYRFGNDSKPNTVVGLNFQVAPGIENSRAGWLFLPNVYFQSPLGDSWDIRADLYSSYGTDNSVGTGSAVGGNTATRRGLDDFSGDAGFKDVGIGVGVTYNLTPSWNVDTALRYQRLLDEAADNPSTSDQGPANQLFGGVLVRYKF